MARPERPQEYYDQIKDKFREYGRITDIALKDGYGFIEFENGE